MAIIPRVPVKVKMMHVRTLGVFDNTSKVVWKVLNKLYANLEWNTIPTIPYIHTFLVNVQSN